MMRLRSAPASPFARKIRIAVEVAGLGGDVELVSTDSGNPDAAFLADNPLSKIPTLILESGETLFDSRVIAAYLDHRAGGDVLVPAEPGQRFAALRFEALSDGIMDAIVLQHYERRWRAEDRRDARWLAHQAGKVERGLVEAERVLGLEAGAAPIHIGHISLACGLGFLDLRFDGSWRPSHPALVSWLDVFAARVPAFERTRLRQS